MKVLWFEISTPSCYYSDNRVVGGWQDSLECIVKRCSDIELIIAFEAHEGSEVKIIDGVTYVPLVTHYTFWEQRYAKFTWKVNEKKLLEKCIKIVNVYKPDLIHVFGCEWPFGLIAGHVNVPVVIHIQGSIIPYNNALYPPKYNGYTFIRGAGLNLRYQFWFWRSTYKDASRLKMEKRIWKLVNNYMGRTEWDHALMNTLHPQARYFHVEEALRPSFLQTSKRWKMPQNNKVCILSVGCGSFWKGVDVMLKTAHVLKSLGVDFEWKVAGTLPPMLKLIIEYKEKLAYAENNIEFLGNVQADRLVDLLCSSTMLVHTAYIENSPNAICEAQYLGVPVISTMVGGIASLVRNGKDGKLVAANDPWQLANAIIELVNDPERMRFYSKNTMLFAQNRHNPRNIIEQLLTCYKEIL